ncbi:MAG: hypothetical protein CMC84_07105 [Flavobacteriaceae bacterium]|nr:hypothetical protein [Flavobacteriaceae bacterium]
MKEITKDNWLAPPNNRWSFQNMSFLFKTTKLQKSISPVVLSRNLKSIESFKFEGLEEKKQSGKCLMKALLTHL